MKLDNRMERLENELKILKNEIQQTLLEIQEQVLIHYYPSLRAEDPNDSQAVAPVLEALRATKTKKKSRGEVELGGLIGVDLADLVAEELAAGNGGKPANAARHRPPPAGLKRQVIADVDLEDDDDDDELEEQPGYSNGGRRAPATKEVSLSELRQPRAAAADETAPARPKGRGQFAALADWVGDSVTRVGKARIKEAVEAYAIGGYLTSDTRDVLLRLIAMAEDDAAPESASPRVALDLLMQLDGILTDGD